MTVNDINLLENIIFLHPVFNPSVLFTHVCHTFDNIFQLIQPLQLLLQRFALEAGIDKFHLEGIFISIYLIMTIESLLKSSQADKHHFRFLFSEFLGDFFWVFEDVSFEVDF